MSEANPLLQKYIAAYDLEKHLNRDLLRVLRLVQVPAGEAVYAQSGEQLYLYFLVAGKLQVNYTLRGGKTAVLGFLEPFAVVGDLEVFNEGTVRNEVVAVEASTLLALERTFVLKYGYDDPRFLRLIIGGLAQKLHSAGTVLTTSALPLIRRFAAYLLAQAEPDGVVALGHKPDLASSFGATGRHLNRVIRLLEAEAIVETEGSVLRILDWEGLRQYGEF